MKPMINQSFWSDPEIEQQQPEIKLAMLWLITNPQTSILGICQASERRFHFETGLPPEALQRACEALPGALKRIGSAIFVKNYIRHQFGSGDRLKRNNFFKALSSEFIAQSADIQNAIASEYSEFQPVSPAADEKPLARASEGLTKPKEREEQVRKGKEGVQGERLSDDEMVAQLSAGLTSEQAWALLERNFHDRDVRGEWLRFRAEREKQKRKVDWRGLVAWLNKAGTVANLTPKRATPDKDKTPVPDPDGWQQWIADNYPDHAGLAYTTAPESLRLDFRQQQRK